MGLTVMRIASASGSIAGSSRSTSWKPPRVSARPAGLERALTRGGFQLVEREDPAIDPDADAILITVNPIDQDHLADLLPAPNPGSPGTPPRIVVFAATDRD